MTFSPGSDWDCCCGRPVCMVILWPAMTSADLPFNRSAAFLLCWKRSSHACDYFTHKIKTAGPTVTPELILKVMADLFLLWFWHLMGFKHNKSSLIFIVRRQQNRWHVAPPVSAILLSVRKAQGQRSYSSWCMFIVVTLVSQTFRAKKAPHVTLSVNPKLNFDYVS